MRQPPADADGTRARTIRTARVYLSIPPYHHHLPATAGPVPEDRERKSRTDRTYAFHYMKFSYRGSGIHDTADDRQLLRPAVPCRTASAGRSPEQTPAARGPAGTIPAAIPLPAPCPGLATRQEPTEAGYEHRHPARAVSLQAPFTAPASRRARHG
jgi:hypothetical protein